MIFFYYLSTVARAKIAKEKGVEVNHWLIAGAIVCGYFFAWISHAFIEKNKPATFTYPLWSLFGDFKMWWEILNGKHRVI